MSINVMKPRPAGLPAKWQSLKAWLWSFATLTSRTMFVPWDSAGALTPFGDLHNYQPPPQGFLPDVMGVVCSNVAHDNHLIALMPHLRGVSS